MMAFPLSFWDLSLWTAVIAIILLVTSELLSPHYGRTGLMINRKRLRNVALVVSLVFLATVGYRIYYIVTYVPPLPAPAPATVTGVVTAHGKAQIDTTQQKFGGASARFSGTGDYLSVSDSAGWNSGPGNFTVDLWVRFAALPEPGSSQAIYSQYQDANHYAMIDLLSSGGTYSWRLLAYWGGASPDINFFGATTITANHWYHVAFVRSADNWHCFQDGNQVWTATASTTISDYSGGVQIGALNGGSCYDGWLDEFRVSKGVARWTDNFTAPTTPYDRDRNTVILLHMDGPPASTGFPNDASPRIITPVNHARIDTNQSVFGGASGRFEGHDYLATPDSESWDFAGGNFTVDSWVRFAVLPEVGSSQTIYSQYQDANNYITMDLLNNGGIYSLRLLAYWGGASPDINFFGATTISANVWYHIVYSRAGDNWYCFQDGNQVWTATASKTISDYSVGVQIGALNGGACFNGWLDEFRVSKGVAHWTGNFTAPTSAYSADTYAVLLLHMDGPNGSTDFPNDTPL